MPPSSAERDLFEMCIASPELIEVIGRALERAGWALQDGELERELELVRGLLGAVVAGDWTPIEQHLEGLGTRYARAGLAASAWHSAGAAVSRALMTRAVARLAADPDRLTELLVTLAAHTDRILSAIVRGYHVAKEVDNALLVGTLEQRVAERTAALEAAHRDMEAFSYSVSHDLRTPLRAIDGFSLALLEDHQHDLDDTAQGYLRRIRAAAQRMGALIDDLLALARVSRVSLHLVALDISPLADEIVAELRRRDPGRVTPVHVAPGLSVRADARLLRIALENLLGNAWKYTAKHPRAEIWVGGDDGAFHVRDTGAGFDMAYSDKLFEPFERLHGHGEYEGTGIGLAIVARIIALHGGRIWATGALDQGATFFFTLGACGVFASA